MGAGCCQVTAIPPRDMVMAPTPCELQGGHGPWLGSSPGCPVLPMEPTHVPQVGQGMMASGPEGQLEKAGQGLGSWTGLVWGAGLGSGCFLPRREGEGLWVLQCGLATAQSSRSC